MNSITFFLSFIPFLALILLSLNLIFAPHNSYQEKSSTFECGFHSFLGQNRTQFNISFFVFGLLFLLFDMELVLLFPGALSLVVIDIYGLILMLVFFVILTAGFAFELGKKALNIDSRQNENKLNREVEHNIYYSYIEYYIAIINIYHYCKKRSMVNSIIFILEKSISKFNSIILYIFLIIKEYILKLYSIILYIFLIIKEYISKFDIIKLIIGFIILKVITFMAAFKLYIFRIIQDIDTVISLSSYLILLLIVIMFLRTPLKNIPKVIITLMLNSIVIGFIITLVCYCFNIEIFSFSTLAAYTYFMSQNMEADDYFTLVIYDYIGPGSKAYENSLGNPGGGPGGGGPGGPNNDPLITGSEQNSSSDPRDNVKTKGKPAMQKWHRFVRNWADGSLHTEASSKVTRADLLNSIDKDIEIRTKDSKVIHNAFTELYKDKWPAHNTPDPVFAEIKEALNKDPENAFKYKNDNELKSKRVLENSIKRLEKWTRDEAYLRIYDHHLKDLPPLREPEVIPPPFKKVNVHDLLT